MINLNTNNNTQEKPAYHDWISVNQPTWVGIRDMVKDVITQELQTFPRSAKKERLVILHIEKMLLKKWEEF